MQVEKRSIRPEMRGPLNLANRAPHSLKSARNFHACLRFFTFSNVFCRRTDAFSRVFPEMPLKNVGGTTLRRRVNRCKRGTVKLPADISGRRFSFADLMPVPEKLALLVHDAAQSALSKPAGKTGDSADSRAQTELAAKDCLVVDTNVVLDLIHWHDPGAAALAGALGLAASNTALNTGSSAALPDTGCPSPEAQSPAVWRAAMSAAAALELAEVLSRPMFGYSPEAVEALLKDWFSRVHWIDEAAVLAARARAEALGLRCLDPLDQKFLELSIAANARALITKDKLVLKAGKKMRRLFGIPALTPSAARALFEP